MAKKQFFSSVKECKTFITLAHLLYVIVKKLFAYVKSLIILSILLQNIVFLLQKT